MYIDSNLLKDNCSPEDISSSTEDSNPENSRNSSTSGVIFNDAFEGASMNDIVNIDKLFNFADSYDFFCSDVDFTELNLCPQDKICKFRGKSSIDEDMLLCGEMVPMMNSRLAEDSKKVFDETSRAFQKDCFLNFTDILDDALNWSNIKNMPTDVIKGSISSPDTVVDNKSDGSLKTSRSDLVLPKCCISTPKHKFNERINMYKFRNEEAGEEVQSKEDRRNSHNIMEKIRRRLVAQAFDMVAKVLGHQQSARKPSKVTILTMAHEKCKSFRESRCRWNEELARISFRRSEMINKLRSLY